MATSVGHGPEARALMNLLCQAAGVEDVRSIRAIECRVSFDEAVQFTIESLGQHEHIQTAVGSDVVARIAEIQNAKRIRGLKPRAKHA